MRGAQPASSASRQRVRTSTSGRRASGRESRIGHRRREIIAAGLGKLEKFGSHDGADCVAADVLSIGVAATVTKEPRPGLHRTDVKPVAKTFLGALGRPPPFPLPSLSIAELLDRRYPREYWHPPWEGQLRFRRYRISEGHEKPFVTRSVRHEVKF
jgi:hypothetical protein